jgi:hypothetical protein
MNDNRRWLPVLIGCLLLGVVHGQELWSGTRAGMSPDEVVRLVPNAYRTTAGPEFRAFEAWPGMSLQARVDRVEVLGANARVMFGFINNGLERVVLGFSTDGMSISAFDNQCRTLRAALNGRYGPEGSVSEDRRGTAYSDGDFREYLWFSGQTRIELSCTSSVSSLSPRDPILILGIYYHHVGSSGL